MMLLLGDRGSRTNIGFLLSLCRVRLVVEIVDHCCFCLIISLINFIPLIGLSENSFY